jgi:hypothetical protein
VPGLFFFGGTRLAGTIPDLAGAKTRDPATGGALLDIAKIVGLGRWRPQRTETFRAYEIQPKPMHWGIARLRVATGQRWESRGSPSTAGRGDRLSSTFHRA